MRRLAAATLLGALTLAPAAASESSACRVLTDERGDVAARKATGSSDDLVAVWLDGDDDAVVAVEIEVAKLAARASARGERWEVSWVNPWLDGDRAQQRVIAERTPDGVVFSAASGSTAVAAAGTLDPERNLVRIVVPRAPLRLLDSTRLEQVRATSWILAGEAAHERDVTTEGAWTVGTGCDTPVVQPCPVVIDAAGDAGLGRDRRTQDPSLDIRAVGVAPAGDALELSLRVEGTTRAPDADVREWGYTITWRYGGVRWFAQAEREVGGTVFRYGRAAGRGPTLAGGARAAGRIEGRLLRIWVPRARVGAPADGDALLEVTAWSWLLAGSPGAAAYHTVDDTAARRATAGISCGA